MFALSEKTSTRPGWALDPTRLALAALGPVAIGGVLAARAGELGPLAMTPAIMFGIVAATCPALYIAIAATKESASLAHVMRALGTSLCAFGVALAGLVLPALFLSLSSVSDLTTFVVCSCVLGAAGVLAMIRMATELAPRTVTGIVVCIVWAVATLGIAGRLWVDLAVEVLS
jgi:hypothetical protein